MSFRFRKLDFSTYSCLTKQTQSLILSKRQRGLECRHLGWTIAALVRRSLTDAPSPTPFTSYLLTVRLSVVCAEGGEGSYECFGFCFFWLKSEYW